MKKIVALLLIVASACCVFVGCGSKVDPNEKSEGVMTYAEYDAAALDSDVVIEAFVQATQAWWNDEGKGKITVYLQDGDGAYFAYELACSEADSKKLTKGTKIKVSGYKGAWAGEVEIMDGTFEFVDTKDTWVAEAFDATSLLGTDDLIKHQNKFAKFTGMTVKSIEYQGGSRGKDIYVTFVKDGNEYSFCVESYLTSAESELYIAVEALSEGDVVDVEGFLYWYNGINTHITSVTKK